MATAESTWRPEHSRQFKDHADTVHGHVRYELTHANLQLSLGELLERPISVISLGEGPGIDLDWAKSINPHNYAVYVDPDPTMFATTLGYNPPRFDKTVWGDSQTALDESLRGQFDLAFSHGVLMYLADPAAELARIRDLLGNDGHLSLITANFFGKANRLELEGDLPAQHKLKSTGIYTTKKGALAKAYLPQEIEDMLDEAGFDVVDKYGIITDPRTDQNRTTWAELGTFHQNRIMEAELRMSRDRVDWANGQLLHYVARKT